MSTNDVTGASQPEPEGPGIGDSQPQASVVSSQTTQETGGEPAWQQPTAEAPEPSPGSGLKSGAESGSEPGAGQPVSPYTSVPAAPAGYSFTRQEPAGSSWGTSAGRSAASSAGTVGESQPLAPYGTVPAGGYAYTSAAADSIYGTPAYGEGAGLGGSEAGTSYGEPGSARGARRRGPGWGGVIAATLAAALLSSGGTAALMHYTGSSSAPTASAPVSVATGATTKTVSATGSAPDWEAVTSAVANSVVSITVKTSSGTAVGSGVIFDAEGHVVTNNHVVAGASQIQVTLADGRIYVAELTGTDPATDLAVIKLTDAPTDLTVAQFGDSDEVATGQGVMAIGNPLGLSSTVTTGIVSAVNRPVVTTQEESDDSSEQQGSSRLPGGLEQFLRPQSTVSSQTYTNAIQIDAAVNPGNSGGPLFDETGHVIGITSSIAQVSQGTGSIGLGFAIPGNLATKVAHQLITSGKATHAYLGVSIGDGAAQVGDVTRAGAQVGSVESGSPADKAGIKQGDVITAINGKATSQAAALTGFVRLYSAGDTVTLTLVRSGQEQQVEATLAEREDS